MRTRTIVSAIVVAAACWQPSLWAALIVNDPQPITRRVSVQIIQTALDDGTSPATVFGSASQRASIETGVDTIWAQAGIDVYFLPTINNWNNTFAYEGNEEDFDINNNRLSSDLSTIVSTGDAAGVTSSVASVINEFFVRIAPGFGVLGGGTVAGIANIGRDGTAQYVGSSLLTSQNGRDAIAGVVAHEIGHVLGLYHAANGTPNLMSPQGTSEELTSEQIAAIFQTTSRNDSIAHIPAGGTGFPQLIPPSLTGDYNNDHIVNAADYTVWRNTLGSRSNLAADGNHNLVVDSGDFNVWKANFGETGGAGSVLAQAIPEPSTLVHFVASLVLAASSGRRRPRGGRV